MIVQCVPITQPPSTLCMYIGNFMPEIHSCIIRIISKVFNIREYEKQRSLILFSIRGQKSHGEGRYFTDKFLPGGQIVMSKILPGIGFSQNSIVSLQRASRASRPCKGDPLLLLIWQMSGSRRFDRWRRRNNGRRTYAQSTQSHDTSWITICVTFFMMRSKHRFQTRNTVSNAHKMIPPAPPCFVWQSPCFALGHSKIIRIKT